MTPIIAIAQRFGCRSAAPRPDLELPGSPQRCRSRQAVQDADGRIWVIEELVEAQAVRRERITRLLMALGTAGLPVPEFRHAPDGALVLRHEGRPWQCSAFVPGAPLPRPDYVFDPARGEALGDFLVDMARAESGAEPAPKPEAKTGDKAEAQSQDETEATPPPAPTQVQLLLRDLPPLDLPAHLSGLMTTMRNRRPALGARLEKPLSALAPLLRAWPELPTRLAHGDFHPLNVIWREGPGPVGIAAVIDWEFCGPRPILYDAANAIGCAAVEDPAAFGSGLIPALLGRLRAAGLFTPEDAPHLAQLVLALRFGWISEWLRADDEEMLDLELDFMDLLARDQGAMARAWAK